MSKPEITLLVPVEVQTVDRPEPFSPQITKEPQSSTIPPESTSNPGPLGAQTKPKCGCGRAMADTYVEHVVIDGREVHMFDGHPCYYFNLEHTTQITFFKE
jgi:hypothetical protein